MSRFTIDRFAPLFVILCFAVAAVAPTRAQEVTTEADFAILMDARTGNVLYEKNGTEQMAPASMTKLMTSLLVFDRLKNGELSLDDKFFVSVNAWKKGGSKMWVQEGTQIRVEDLLRGIIVQSGNDACIVVAEALAGTESRFAEMMTERGEEIGLENTVFKNSTGWPDPEHMTTAKDLALIARYIIQNHSDFYDYYKEVEFTWEGIRQPNRNPLLYVDSTADGLKTGHTEASGYGLVGSAVRKGRRLIVVVNGLDSEKQRKMESKRLLDIGFREFKDYDLYAAGDKIDKAKVWNGRRPSVGLEVREPISVVMHRRARKNIRAVVNYDGPLSAPIDSSQQVATLTISAPGLGPLEYPVYPTDDVKRTGVLGQMGTALKHLLLPKPQQVSDATEPADG